MSRPSLTIAVLCLFLCLGLVACGGQSGSGEPREEPGDAPAEPKTSRPSEPGASETSQASDPPAPQTAIGEVLPPEDFDLRVLEVAILDQYFYLEELYSDGTAQSTDAFPMAGKFVVVTYSVRNTGSSALNVGFSGTLSTEGGESFEESDDAFHPNALLDEVSGGFELQPRGLELGQFVFDVPTDAEPAALTTGYTKLGDSAASAGGISQAGDVDLTRQDEPGPPPEEILALLYEYSNMQSWDLAYDLYAERVEGEVSEELYTRVNTEDPPYSILEYSFPSVEVQGDNATVERIYTGSESNGETYQDTATSELVLEGGAWRILMRDEQLKYYDEWTPPEETTG